MILVPEKGTFALKAQVCLLEFYEQRDQTLFYEPAYQGKHKETVDCSDLKKLPEQLVS